MSSTNSTRLSSFGGTRTMRDCRPIEDKDWQLNTQRKVIIINIFVCYVQC